MYGQIAAANALSDVYAMGGEPTFALNILCFPSSLPLEMLREILDGGYQKIKEAGAIIAGGHSIDDPIPKYGLCVSGMAHPGKIWSNATAREGDLLILTKPLGSGITTTAAKAGVITPEELAPSAAVMATLNKGARDAVATLGASACTDITGFGLLGHAEEMARGSGKTIQIFAGKAPLLPGVLSLAERGMAPGGAARNQEYLQESVTFAQDVAPALQSILWDPQTSGGLLVSIPERDAGELLKRLEEPCPQAVVIGQVLPREDVSIRVIH